MRKKFGAKLIISSIVILLPIVFGLLFWNRTPELLASHWGFDGQADGWSGRGMAVFGLPLIMLAAHWLCLFATLKLDPKNRGMDGKALGLIFWLIPVISNYVALVIYSTAFGKEWDQSLLMSMLFGLMFIVIGNYLPKCRQNYTMGIKVPWTLNNEENWNATHRFAGKVWVFGGILMMPLYFLPSVLGFVVMFAAIFALAFSPAIYSWWFFKKQQSVGKEIKPFRYPGGKWAWLIPAILIPVLVVVMFTGSITFELSEDALTVDSTFYSPLTVSYEDIDSVELRQGKAPGHRDWGYGSARLLLGGFSNEEFGGYTRYTYTFSDSYIVIKAGKNVLVIADKNAEYTEILYNNLCEKIG